MEKPNPIVLTVVGLLIIAVSAYKNHVESIPVFKDRGPYVQTVKQQLALNLVSEKVNVRKGYTDQKLNQQALLVERLSNAKFIIRKDINELKETFSKASPNAQLAIRKQIGTFEKLYAIFDRDLSSLEQQRINISNTSISNIEQRIQEFEENL